MDPEWLAELFSSHGTPAIRRMFGGQGVHLDGRMVALVAGGVLYLKSDAESAALFEAEGLEPFSYMAKGERRVMTSYRRCPPAALEDPDEMGRWVGLARAAAMRAAEYPPARKSARKSARKPPAKMPAVTSAG